MPDIPFFDANAFFAQKIGEVEQSLISKKAEVEILYANRRNLEHAIRSLSLLSAGHQRVIQQELSSLREVLTATERSILALESEVELLAAKLAALQAARSIVEVRENQN